MLLAADTGDRRRPAHARRSRHHRAAETSAQETSAADGRTTVVRSEQASCGGSLHADSAIPCDTDRRAPAMTKDDWRTENSPPQPALPSGVLTSRQYAHTTNALHRDDNVCRRPSLPCARCRVVHGNQDPLIANQFDQQRRQCPSEQPAIPRSTTEDTVVSRRVAKREFPPSSTPLFVTVRRPRVRIAPTTRTSIS
jgi:hypothetical protein